MYHGNPSLSRRFRLVLSSFLQQEGLPFAEVLPEKRIAEIFAAEGGEFAQDEDCIYTPPVTLWAWLSQVLFKQEHRACLDAVCRVSVLMMALGREPCSTNTGAYCRARVKLPEPVIRRLCEEVAAGCEASLPDNWLWHHRHVCLVDGTTETMPDTLANRDEYPQNVAQKEGLGFPIVRLVVLLSLATAMVSGMAFGRYSGKETGETALLRQLLDGVGRDTILLTDRYFCSYFMIALVLQGQRDFVTRLHQRRKTDFQKSKRLGKGDHLVEWKRPARPEWMDQATYDQIPETITVRQIEVQVREPGFRVESLTVVTTLADVKEYPAKDIADLYRKRWLAELDIRAIKCSLGMDVLRCKTPAMVRKEMWTGMLAYNLIRRAMLQSAMEAGVSPRQLSFTAAMDAIAAALPLLSWIEGDLAEKLAAAGLAAMAEHIVGNRPNRVEPRAVKRRPQPLALLTKPRDQARAELMRGAA